MNTLMNKERIMERNKQRNKICEIDIVSFIPPAFQLNNFSDRIEFFFEMEENHTNCIVGK